MYDISPLESRDGPFKQEQEKNVPGGMLAARAMLSRNFTTDRIGSITFLAPKTDNELLTLNGSLKRNAYSEVLASRRSVQERRYLSDTPHSIVPI